MIKKTSLLLTLLLGALLSLHAMPMEDGGRFEEATILSNQQEKFRASTNSFTANGAGGGGIERGDLEDLSISEEEEEVATQNNPANKAPSSANLHSAAGEESESWDDAADAAEKAGWAQEQAFAAEQSGNQTLAAKWQEIGAFYKRSIDLLTKAAEAQGQGKKEEGNNLHNAGAGLYNAGLIQEHTLEAEQEGNKELVARWGEIGELYQKSIEPYIKAEKAYHKGKRSEGQSWNAAGVSLYNVALSKEHALTAEQEGNKELVAKWGEIAELYQKSIEPYIKAGKAYHNGKASEGQRWNAAGISLHNIALSEEQALAAKQAGNKELAARWGEVSRLRKQSMEAYTKAAEARAQRKIEEGTSWNNAGFGFYNAALTQEQALVAEQSGNKELAVKWGEVAELGKQFSEAYTKAAEAHRQGEIMEGQSWDRVGWAFYNAAWFRERNNLPQVTEYIARAKEAKIIAERLVAARF